MGKIKELYFFNKPKKKLKSYLDSFKNNYLMNVLALSPFKMIHNLLPLQYKFLDESFIYKDKKNIGIITVSPVNGNSERMIISQLSLSKNAFDVAEKLINFVLQKYGEKGVASFYSLIDEKYVELAQVLLSRCGFRQCSTHKIWKVRKKVFKKSNTIKYRRFKDSDLNDIAGIYNDSLLTLFKPTLKRDKKEFSEFIYHGLTYTSDYRYIIEDNSSNRIIGYFLISTNDNDNYIIDFNYSDGYEIDIDSIMSFATREILKRQRRFKLYIKVKNYLTTAKNQEIYAQEKKFKLVSTKLVLVKDFYKPIKQTEKLEEYMLATNLQ